MTNEFMLTDEMVTLLRKVLLLTREGKLAWEFTADPDTIIAPLGNNYVAKLEMVSDFENNDPEAEPDHILSILKGSKFLFSVDRRNFSKDKELFLRYFSDIVPQSYYPFNFFKELWDRAYFKSTKITEEINNINSILDNIK